MDLLVHMAETEQDLCARFGTALRSARTARKWSQAQLAELLDVSVDYVGMLERGERLPSFAVAIHVAEVLGTSVVALLGAPLAEPWQEEAVALLRSLDPGARELVVAMLRAAAATAPAAQGEAATGPGPPKRRRPR